MYAWLQQLITKLLSASCVHIVVLADYLRSGVAPDLLKLSGEGGK